MSVSTQDALLELLTDLDEGAPTARFEADLDAAELPSELAARVRSLNQRLQRSRRREELLRVLHDTATDLTALRDVEAVLQAIVARTRQLVGSDMAYISLNDYEREETYIRKSDGVVTPEYRSIRMPLGTGVLGKAATGLSPVSVVDYVPDPTIIHLAHIDRIVQGEGVRSILGVPLSVHGRVLGALLVAERHVRRFTSDPVPRVAGLRVLSRVGWRGCRESGVPGVREGRLSRGVGRRFRPRRVFRVRGRSVTRRSVVGAG